jgi:hypothetical protein
MVQVLQVEGVRQAHHALDHLLSDFPGIFSEIFTHNLTLIHNISKTLSA